jgi:hypothetical protein
MYELYDIVAALRSIFLIILVNPTNWWITVSNCYAQRIDYGRRQVEGPTCKIMF